MALKDMADEMDLATRSVRRPRASAPAAINYGGAPGSLAQAMLAGGMMTRMVRAAHRGNEVPSDVAYEMQQAQARAAGARTAATSPNFDSIQRDQYGQPREQLPPSFGVIASPGRMSVTSGASAGRISNRPGAPFGTANDQLMYAGLTGKPVVSPRANPNQIGSQPMAGPTQGVPAGLGPDYADPRLGTPVASAPLARAALAAPQPLARLATPAATLSAPPAAGLSPGAFANYVTPAETAGAGLATRALNTRRIASAAELDPIEKPEEYKHGGVVDGKGTETSDSNVIRVSDGEAILPADVVKANGGEKWVNDMIKKHHKKVKGAPPYGYVNGGVVRVDEPDVEEWNRLAAMYPEMARPRYVAPAGVPLATQAVEQGLAQGRALIGGGKYGQQALVRAVDNQQMPAIAAAPVVAPLAAPAPQYVLQPGQSATAGQPQVRAVDNALIAQAAGADALTNPPPIMDAFSGWGVRDKIRGGAAPSTLDQGSGLTGVRGNFVPQGAGGKPGEEFTYTSGSDKITATADSTGRFNSFSGGQPGRPALADYASGMARAAANREELAAIEAARNAPPDRSLPTDPLAYAALTRAQTGNRLVSQNIVNAAGEQPFEQAGQGAKVDELGARATSLRANALNQQTSATRTAAMTPGDVEQQGIAGAIAKLDLKGRQRVDELGTRIAAATKPEEIEKFGRQYLALLGKDKPEEFTVSHAAGGTDAQGNKTPDTIVVVNKRTGKAEIIAGAGAAKPTAVSKDDHAAMVKRYGEAQVKQMLQANGLKVEG